MSDPEMTFTVHPRPQSDDPRAVAEMAPALALDARRPTLSRIPEVRHRDTFIGDLVFLVQFAFGRY